MTNSDVSPDQSVPRWHALWTHGHCELLVFDQLVGKGFDAFSRRIRTWSRRGRKRHLISEPMFPGYLFLRHPSIGMRTWKFSKPAAWPDPR